MTTVASPLPAPVATYRLQLHAGFTFADAMAVVPYLASLGVSHLYLSPITQAAPGSTHGYDQCDPTRVSEDLGGETGFRRLVTEAREHRLRIVLDIVPNHMATSQANPWWWELLRGGREGPAGAYFDVDWAPGDPELDGRVMVPVLGKPLDEVLAAGELTVDQRGDEQVLRYFDQAFPVRRAEAPAAVPRQILDRQPYLLAFWREAAHRLNYRRFFAINTLVALREEDPAVFAAVHDLPLRMVQQDQVQGLRVDHVDGLRDPGAYLDALRRRATGAWLLVEKILGPGERLPVDWPVDGTTGYDFIHRLQGVFVDPAAEAALTRTYAGFTGEPADYGALVHDCKLRAARELFGSDMARLQRLFAGVCAERGVSATPGARITVLEQVAACFPVYRAYVRPGQPAREADRGYVETALGRARELDPTLDAGLLELLGKVLLLEVRGEPSAELAARFQQLSGPLMAKGVEDTVFYRYNRLVCLNEVGGDPGSFGVSPEAFHAANRETLDQHPAAMLASSTHDTKRSEDVRARLSLLAQVPDRWAAAVARWSVINGRHRRGALPDRNAEYLLYQTLVGAWPLDQARAIAYMEKAAREAGQHTSWVDPDVAYEDALRAFVGAVSREEEFQADLRAFVQPLVEPGRVVSLAMTLVKLTSPGIPDLYQGSELWDLSLVDPDNRRPVDYRTRRELLQQQQGSLRPGSDDPASMLTDWDAGLPKLHVIAEGLGVRRSSAAAFAPGSTYTSLRATGAGADRLLAFARGDADDPHRVVIVVPRLTLAVTPDWSATSLELGQGEWANELSGSPVRGPRPMLREVFGEFPVALLERQR
jgi:(1->4)-alpha-D-glucan 1-alpha-D-glucosylmutase